MKTEEAFVRVERERALETSPDRDVLAPGAAGGSQLDDHAPHLAPGVGVAVGFDDAVERVPPLDDRPKLAGLGPRAKELGTFADIGYRLSRKGTAILVAGYTAAALILFAFVEISLGHVTLDPAKLAALPGLYPDTTIKRLVFMVMALAAGLSEEITYRGFAIRGLQSLRMNRWLAVLIAAIPFVFQHGLKSVDQFWWFFGSGLALGALFVLSRRLIPGIIIHWVIILSAMLGIFTAIQA